MGLLNERFSSWKILIDGDFCSVLFIELNLEFTVTNFFTVRIFDTCTHAIFYDFTDFKDIKYRKRITRKTWYTSVYYSLISYQ